MIPHAVDGKAALVDALVTTLRSMTDTTPIGLLLFVTDMRPVGVLLFGSSGSCTPTRYADPSGFVPTA